MNPTVTSLLRRLRDGTAFAWIADHRVRLASVALGAALVGLGVLADAGESRGADLTPQMPPPDGRAAATPAVSPAPAITPPADSVAIFHMPPLNQYGEVTERPLFSSDRRAHQAVKQAVAPPLPFTLRGIVVQSTGHYALIEEGSPAVSKRVMEGEVIGGGTVKEILRDRIVLNMNGGEAVVRLFDPSTTNGKHTPVLPTGGFPSQVPPGSVMGPGMRPPMSGG